MNTIARIAITSLIVVVGTSAQASIPANKDRVSMRNILELPLGQRLDRIQSRGPTGYRALVNIMFDETESMDNRWKAVTAAAKVGGNEAKPEIIRALKSPTWFMRNAGLIAMQSLDRKEALVWAKQLVDDKALLVRVAAVDSLAELGSEREASVLWERLYSPKNFKGGQSLFIRSRIVEALARLEGPGREAAFVKVLSDRDESLHPAAMQALERSTRKSFGPTNVDLGARRAQWLNWWKTRNG